MPRSTASWAQAELILPVPPMNRTFMVVFSSTRRTGFLMERWADVLVVRCRSAAPPRGPAIDAPAPPQYHPARNLTTYERDAAPVGAVTSGAQTREDAG